MCWGLDNFTTMNVPMWKHNYDRQIYIDANFNVTHDLLASLVVKGEVDFIDSDDPVEHPGIVFRYTDKMKNDCYN